MCTTLLAIVSAVLAAAAPTSTVTASTPHLSLQAIVEPDVVAPGSELTITLTVTPARGVRVYAPGSEYQAVAVKMDPQPGVTARTVAYPPSEIYHFEPLDERVPVYQKPFTLKQVLRVSAAALKGKSSLAFSGKLQYQACNDTVCFKPGAVPFEFELAVKR
jgi:DsbC/DsbD-like thiol-disulfide interchange protein